MTMPASAWPTCPCGDGEPVLVHSYAAPPAGETRFELGGAPYRRELWRCGRCGHFLSRAEMDLSALYLADYVDTTYGGAAGLRRSFERIMALPEGKSDNLARVARIQAFSAAQGLKAGRVLDVGAGLCVFLAAMRQRGWDCLALDTDPRQVRHARACAGVEAACGEFGPGCGLGLFQLVTFNKVLEHVMDPVAMLAAAGECLVPEGVVYLELPDGEAAWRDPLGPGREEFFVEHHHVFSAASAAILVARAGLMLLSLERLRQPSGKYDLVAFARVEEDPC